MKIARVHDDLSYYWFRNNLDSALHYGKLAYNALKDSKEVKLFARSCVDVAISFQYKGLYDSAIFYYTESLEASKSINDIDRVAAGYNNLGVLFTDIEQYENAAEFLIKALKTRELLPDSIKVAIIKTNLGRLSNKQNKPHEAIRYYKQALNTFFKYNDLKEVEGVLLNLNATFNRLMQYEKGIVYGWQLKSLAEKAQSGRNLTKSYLNIAGSHAGLGNIDSSIYYNNKALNYFEHIGDSLSIANSIMAIAQLYTTTKEYQKSIDQINQLDNHFDRFMNKEMMRDYVRVKAKAYYGLGQYKVAFDYMEKVVYYKDSLMNEELNNTIADLKLKYQTEQNENKITRLQLQKNEADLAIQKADNQRNLLLLSVGLFIILVAFFMYRNRQKQKTNRLLEEKNLTISDSLREKEVLLKEIHHRVKNNLQIVSSLLNLQLDSLEDPNAMEAIKEGQNRVKSMALIHQKLYMQENLAGINTKEYLEALSASIFSSYNQLSERVTLSADVEDIDLEIDTIIPIALIVNELITNSIKYAFPENMIGKISVTLKRTGEVLRLEVADDGVGMNTESKGTSFGMKLVKSLARKLKATVYTQNNDGTKVQLDISRFKLV